MHRPQISKRNIALLGSTALFAVPTAQAASLPGYGSFDWISLGGLAVVLSILGIVALFGGGGRAIVNRLPFFGHWVTKSAPIFAIGGLLVAATINPGGFFADGFSTASAASADGGADSTGVVMFDAVLHEPTTDLSFYFQDEELKTTINPAVSLYPRGTATDKELVEGSKTASYSGTASSGALTISAVDVQTVGCNVDVFLDLANYYERVVRDVYICVASNALDNNEASVPTITMQKIGTLSLSKTDTTLTCSAGTQCSYQLVLRNSDADEFIQMPAVKWTAGNAGASLDAVDNGDCEIIEVSSTKYIKYTKAGEELAENEMATCTILVTHNSGWGSSVSFNLTADDHFQSYGASTWNTNSNIRGASATSATEVSFA